MCLLAQAPDNAAVIGGVDCHYNEASIGVLVGLLSTSPIVSNSFFVVVVQEARWLVDIDGLLQLSIEEGRFHVHVVDLKEMMCHDCQQ